jgi:hypothetical protein
LFKQNKKKSYLNNKSPTPNSIPKTRARPSIGIALIEHTPFYADSIQSQGLLSTMRVATRTQKRSCVHIENFEKNENMVNLGHKVE